MNKKFVYQVGNNKKSCVVWLLFVLFYVLFVCRCVLSPGDNPIAVNKYIIYHIIPPKLDQKKNETR